MKKAPALYVTLQAFFPFPYDFQVFAFVDIRLIFVIS